MGMRYVVRVRARFRWTRGVSSRAVVQLIVRKRGDLSARALPTNLRRGRHQAATLALGVRFRSRSGRLCRVTNWRLDTEVGARANDYTICNIRAPWTDVMSDLCLSV